MTTTLPSRIDDLHQLVLFPELLGVRSLPLTQCQEAVPLVEREREKRPLTYQQALQAGQLPLFNW